MKLIKILALILGSLYFLASTAKANEKSKQPQAQVVSLYNFIEVVYEFDNHPLKDIPVTSTAKSADLNGYFLRQYQKQNKKILVPAMGKKIDLIPDTPYLVGYRVLNRMDDDFKEYRTLKTFQNNLLKIDTLKEPNIQQSILDLEFFGPLRESVNILFEYDLKQNTLKITADNKEHTFKENKKATLFNEQKTKTIEEWIDNYLTILGVDKNQIDRNKLILDLKSIALEDNTIIIYSRITLISHGEVQIAKQDVLVQWQKAKDKLEKGPYDQAKSHLEQLLYLVPRHNQALKLYDTVLNLLEAKKTPSLIEGTLTFSTGMPNQIQKDLFKKYHAGIAGIADKNDSSNNLQAVSSIKDNKFKLYLPSGTYQLVVAVPGFKTFKEQINAIGRLKKNIQLKENN
ncbi:hypothetical protein ACFLQ1_02370 [Candidatus Auribacterota bacterium]